jgi:hypothetical protein
MGKTPGQAVARRRVSGQADKEDFSSRAERKKNPNIVGWQKLNIEKGKKARC